MEIETNWAKVTVTTFVRGETDHMFRANMQAFGMQIGKLSHVRRPFLST